MFEEFSKIISKIFKFFEKKNNFIIDLFIFIFVYSYLIYFGLLPDFFYINKPSNKFLFFENYFFSTSIFYWIFFLKNLNFFIIDFIFDNINFYFNNIKENLYLLNYDFYKFNIIFSKYGFETIQDFIFYNKILYKINYYSFYSINFDFFRNYTRIWRINFINGNTPLFFYFGLLFLLSNIISLIFLSYLGFYGVFLINFITIILFWLSLTIHFKIILIDNVFFKVNLFKWFIINNNKIVYFEFIIDPISYSFMFLTLTIAIFVYSYSFSYFRYEPNVERLIIFINLFVISMICLVTSGNLIILFLGWELIGLTSFFLINFWSTRISTLKSAFKAFSFNKLSDVCLLISIILLYYLINDISILSINNQISFYNNFFIKIIYYELPIIEIISFFFLICAFIKSAQFGFHLWLPDSMEAPVPASALIHSATLVSAGVFLLLRFSHLFEYSYISYFLIPFIGSITAFFGGICSSFQSDVKKILAYSTISHCGFLMVCFSTYITEYTILYLYIHGFFKAAVFLCVGNIIRFSKNFQDFRRMGLFWKYLPFECFSSFICLLNLSGLPFSIGFYIKHLLLIGVYFNKYILIFLISNIFCAALVGLFYSYRLFFYVFFDFKKSKKIIYNINIKQNLNFKYYTNSSLITNFIIFLFIFFSYFISLFLLNLFLNKNSLGEGLSIFSNIQIQFSEFYKPSFSFINNIFFFNWLILIFINLILYSSWRFINNNVAFLNFFIFIINFILFLYLFL